MTAPTAHPVLGVGDVISVDRPSGAAPRSGEVLEILGPPQRPHYRVRWDDDRVSLHYPADGVRVLVHHRAASRA